MVASVIGDNSDYIETSRRHADAASSRIVQAMTYLPARFVDPDAIRRFYGARSATALDSAERVTSGLEHIGTRRYLTLLEADALRNLAQTGVVHEQERSFRLRPSEIVRTTDRLLEAVASGATELYVTTEFLPYPVVVFDERHAVVDVRANHTYHTINGLYYRDEPGVAAAFIEDVHRIIGDTDRTLQPDQVCAVLESIQALWTSQTTVSVDARDVLASIPPMLRSPR